MDATLERPPDALLESGGNTGSGIVNRQLDLVAYRSKHTPDRPSATISVGIGHQIGDDLGEPDPVGRHT
jgi:hypothetical protein